MTESTLPNFDELWNYDNPSKTEKKFQELLNIHRTSGNEEYIAELLTQIARSQGLQFKFELAHKTLDEADELLKPEMIRAEIRSLLERGRLFNSNKQPEKSIAYFKEAMQKGIDAEEDFFAIDAVHMLGIASPQDEQLDWNLKALDMAEAAHHERARGWRGSLYNNIGYTYMMQEEYDKSIDTFEKLLAYCQEKEDFDFANIARWFIAKVHRLQGNIDQALKGQLELLETHEEKEDSPGFVFEELGECYLALGQEAERKKYFSLAHATFTSDPQFAWVGKQEPERLERIKKLS